MVDDAKVKRPDRLHQIIEYEPVIFEVEYRKKEIEHFYLLKIEIRIGRHNESYFFTKKGLQIKKMIYLHKFIHVL